MASAKQGKSLFTQGKKIVTSATRNVPQSISENDDNQEEVSQQGNGSPLGLLKIKFIVNSI
jgi:hypothetical protein